ncbi:MAG: glycosidase [Candidatus Njordarchaeales archaeon]
MVKKVLLEKFEGNPILKPRSGWEKEAVFNPAAFFFDGKVFLFYRANGDWSEAISRLGIAWSRDGYHFERFGEPIFEPKLDFEKWGIQDPRTTIIGDTLYMTYVGCPGRCDPPLSILEKMGLPREEFERIVAEKKGTIPRIGLASLKLEFLKEPTKIKNKFIRYGPITPPDVHQRDAALFSEKINGLYAMVHRPRNWVGPEYGTHAPSIWIGYSRDLINWGNHRIVMRPRENWESEKIGAGPPPIKTERGWLLIYHGVDDKHVYRAGAALLDLDDPLRVIGRLSYPILEPKEDYERIGVVPNVVFPEGAVVLNGELFVYYGAADKYCCVATCDLEELLDALEESGE